MDESAVWPRDQSLGEKGLQFFVERMYVRLSCSCSVGYSVVARVRDEIEGDSVVDETAFFRGIEQQGSISSSDCCVCSGLNKSRLEIDGVVICLQFGRCARILIEEVVVFMGASRNRCRSNRNRRKRAEAKAAKRLSRIPVVVEEIHESSDLGAPENPLRPADLLERRDLRTTPGR